jgi:type IX secretion system PorP/SprF family membrane protein
MKKKYFIVPVLLLVLYSASAQQRPHYTQYILDQWVGLNGAPKTSYLSIQGPIGKKDYRTSSTSYQMPGQNPRGRNYWESYTAAEPHHGIGLTVVNDKTGSFNRFTANATYAYHLGLTPTTNLSAGFSAGITNISIDRTKHDFTGNGDPFDPATGVSLSGELNKIRPDLGFGMWLYSRNYFVGLSAQQIIPQKIAFTDDAAILTKGRLVPHVFLTAGYRFLLGEDVNAIPSVMLKYIKGSSEMDFQPEMNVKLQYRDDVWVGGSYRYENGYAAMAGINIGNTMNIGYAYDFTTTALNTVSRGTHEFIVGFLIGNKYSEKCPRCW